MRLLPGKSAHCTDSAFWSMHYINALHRGRCNARTTAGDRRQKRNFLVGGHLIGEPGMIAADHRHGALQPRTQSGISRRAPSPEGAVRL